MNVETFALVERILEIGERAYIQVREIVAREKAGNPLTDAELLGLQSDSNAAHAVIQGWTPPAV